MKSKGTYLSIFYVILLMVCFAVDWSPAQNLPVEKDAGQKSRGLSPGASAEPDSPRVSSEQWHSYLWESLPSDWLQDSDQAVLLEAYQENGWNPFFITAHFEVDPGVHLLLKRLERAQNEAIDPRPFNLDDLKERIEKLAELRLSLQALDPGYRDSTADSSGSASPQKQPPKISSSGTNQAMGSSQFPVVNPDKAAEKERSYRELFQATSAIDVRLAHNLVRFAKVMNPFSKELQVNALLGKIPMDQFLKELDPPSAQYQVLVLALQRYQHFAAQISQQWLVQTQKLSLGDAGNSVRDLQKRLQQEDFYHAKITGYFDETTKQAVQQFQLFHNLDTDGKVGQQTREWLNVSFQAKADMIAQALRLYRQSQTRRFQKFVWINIPQFTLEYRNEGKVEAVHRVIVGKASGKKIKFNGRLIGENQTPALASTIEEVVINPRWYVTDRIRMELSDEIAADPSYLSRNGYVQMTSARYPSGEPRLIQLPGPNNALGRVRFDFPNAYAVYMHDTPNKYLFQRARRDLSHGCIRVEKAHELARELLTDDRNPAASKIEAYLATSRETFLRLHEPVPIIIEYVPVVVNPKGDLVFCGDPYGLFPENSDRKS